MVISNYFVRFDNVSDYIPILSTATNLTDLFQKTVIMPFLDDDVVRNSPYYTHLNKKSFSRCFYLLVPVLGNILIGASDLINRKYDDKNFMLDAVRKYGGRLSLASDRLKDDKDIVLAAVRSYGFALKDASDRLKDDEEVVLAAVQNEGTALKYASERLKNNKCVVLAAVQKNRFASEYASDWLKRDPDVAREIASQNDMNGVDFLNKAKELLEESKKQLSRHEERLCKNEKFMHEIHPFKALL